MWNRFDLAKSCKGLIGGTLLTLALGGGCGGGNDIEEGVPKDTGYVAPKMQPNTFAMPKGKPQVGATEKDKQEAAAKAKAADAAGAPSP